MSKECPNHANETQQDNEWLSKEDTNQGDNELSKWLTSETALLTGFLLAVCFVVLLVHWPVLSARALSFDDDQYLTQNRLVQNPSWGSAWRFLSEVQKPSTVEGYYQPLTMISLMLDCALGGRADYLKPFHRTSLALHMVNTALMAALLYLLFGRAWVAAVLGLLFGFHPMTVEPIPWVGERKTLLAAFFALWCIVFYVWYARKKDRRVYVGCVLLYCLGLLSKPTSIPVPMVMILMDYWPLRRLSRRTVLEKVPLFVLGGVFAVITYISQTGTATHYLGLPADTNPWRVPLVICHNIIFYLYKIVWPANLSSHYAYPAPLTLSHPMILMGVIGTCILVPLLLISLRWTRAVLIGWLIFFVAILPTMQIVRFSIVIASDKFVYLPSVGLLMILASLLLWLFGTGERAKVAVKRTTVAAIVLVLAAAEAVATRQCLIHWRDTVSLYEHMLTLTPGALPVHYNLGNTLLMRGKLDEAIPHFREVLRVNPDDVTMHNNLGLALLRKNKPGEAMGHFQKVLDLEPNDLDVLTNLGTALLAKGKLDEAVVRYRRVLEFDPDSFEANQGVAVVLQAQGKLDQAIYYFRRALASGDSPMLHCRMASALLAQGKAEEAISHYRQALRLSPDYVKALYVMARILATHPNQALRDTRQAIELAKRAAELTGYKNPAILDTLGAAYAASGQFERAVATAEAALALASASKADELAEQIRERLELYRQEKAYREHGQEQNEIRP
jgi:tetratricopeptide (TPR) repeat protein